MNRFFTILLLAGALLVAPTCKTTSNATPVESETDYCRLIKLQLDEEKAFHLALLEVAMICGSSFRCAASWQHVKIHKEQIVDALEHAWKADCAES